MNRLVDELKNFASVTLEKMLVETNKNTKDNLTYLQDTLNYDACCISNIFQNIDKIPVIKMKYDIEKFIAEDSPTSIEKYLFENIPEIKFVLQDNQKDIIKRSLELYGYNDLGISRILTKVFVKKILRNGLNSSKAKKQPHGIIDSTDWPYC